MTSTQIKFSADASAVTAALDAVQTKVTEVNNSLNAGTVGIDTDTAQKQLDDLVETVEKLTEATKEAANAGHELDFDEVAKSAAEAAKQAEALSQAINSQGAGGGASAVKQQVTDLKGLADTIERVRKVQAVLAQEGVQLSNRQAIEAKKRYDEWRKSGAAGSGKIKNVQFDDFVGGDWRKMALAEIDARRFRRQVLSASGVDVTPPSATPAGEPKQPKEPREPREPREPKQPTPKQVKTLAQFAAGAVQDAVGGIAHTAMPGGGGIGGRIAGRGLAEAAGSEGGMLSMGGIGRMAAGLGIGALAFGAVKAVGAIKDKVGDAQEEGTAYTDLRHAIGQTETDFNVLRASLRDAAHGLGVANNEVVGLGSQFAKLAGVAPGGERDLGADVRTSLAFSRSYGLDPSQGVGLFATERHFGATHNDADNRRLAMMIGDAVGHAGSFAKMPDMIAAVETFTERAARSTLGNTPNTDSFLDQMARLTGLHLNGLDTKGAANIIGQMTNTWHAGGGMGEASRNFRMLSMTNALPGFDAYDLDYVNDSDPNSTVKQAFGPGSTAWRAAESRGDTARLAKLKGYVGKSGNRTLQQIDIDSLFAQYGGKNKNTDQLAEALHNHAGISMPQAYALIEAREKGTSPLGMTESRLGQLGIDTKSMNADYSALAQLHGASEDDLRKTARGYLKQGDLSPALHGALEKRLSGATSPEGVESLRNSLMQIAATIGTPKDEGEQTRQATVDLKNITQDMAAHLVPLTNDIRSGILAMAEKIAGKSDERLKEVEAREFTPQQRAIQAQYDDAMQARDAAIKSAPSGKAAEIDAQIADFRKHHRGNDPATNATLKRLEAQKAQYLSADYSAKQQAALDAANKRLAEAREKIAAEASKEDTGIYFKDYAKRNATGGNTDDARQDQMRALSERLGERTSDGTPSATVADFKKKYGKAAEAAAKELGVSPSFLLGQAGLETGWGAHIVPNTHNLGNIKDFSGGGVEATDNQTGKKARYRQYASDEAYFKDFAAQIKRNWPDAVGAGDNVEKWTRGLERGRNGAYAEDALYSQKQARAIQSVRAVPDEPKVPAPSKDTFGNMPLPPSSAIASGPNGAMNDATTSAVQRFAFEHKITVVDQFGRPRAAPVFTTQLSDPTPAGARKS